MPRNGSGTYSLPASSWNPAVTATTIESSAANTTLADLAAAMTQSVSKDGQTPMTGNLPMGNNKLTGLADGTAATDSIAYGQAAKLSGGNTFAGDQTINGSVSLSGALTVTGAVIFTSGTISVDNLTVTSVASVASLNVTGTANANVLNVASVASVASLTARNLAVTSGIVVGAASGGNLGAGIVNAKGFSINGTAINSSTVARYVGTYATNADLTTTIPLDDTIPTSSEGTQIIAVASVMTTTTTQRIRGIFSGQCASTINQTPIASILRGTTCIQAGIAVSIPVGIGSSKTYSTWSVAFDTAPGAAGAYTMSVRVGPDTATGGTLRMNGSDAARFFGGAMAGQFNLEVYEP
jgi:hypothetical protein